MARTKQTARVVSKPSATSKPPSKVTKPPKSPTAQPAELSETDKLKLKNWLDGQERPFSIVTAAPSLKRKRDAQLQLQNDIFHERLSIRYQVRPKDKWECLRRYKKFTVGNESIATGQCILVMHDDSGDARIDVDAQWKAKVLEVRAFDTEHVYLRVAWINRPEDLASGRKPYHGKNELIPTNQLDVIDAMTVNGSVEVKHWNETDDESAVNEDEFFWRQTYDYPSKTFSKLREICIDSAPHNPDEMILQCGNKDCRKWMHVKCIAEAAVQEAVSNSADAKLTEKKPRPKDAAPQGTLLAAKAVKDSFTAEVVVNNGLSNGVEQPTAESTGILITDADGEQQFQDITCLFCGKEIE